MKLYVNGSLNASASHTGLIDAYASSLMIGYYFNGYIDEPAVFPTALSSTQISAQYSAAGVGCTNISGATGSGYTIGAADVGSRVRVAVTATNSDGSATADSSDTSMVSSGMPVATSAPSISGTIAEGAMLTAADGTWTNSPTSYGYQWQRCSSYSATMMADDPVGYWRLARRADRRPMTPAGTATTASIARPEYAWRGIAIGSSNGEYDTSASLSASTGYVSVPSSGEPQPARSRSRTGSTRTSGRQA